jgi:hypothetical protein
MTNKYNNWERLEQVLKYLKLSANAFAVKIGMVRSENIYHIKRGNFGISNDLVDRIVAVYPMINPTWLLSGIGDMLLNAKGEHSSIPFYEGDIEEVLKSDNITNIKSLGRYQLPYQSDCEIAVRSLTRAMALPGNAATDLFLKLVKVEEMIQGNEYVLSLENRVLWRKIRNVKGNSNQWRLVAVDRDEFPDIIIDKSEIRSVWRVMARLSILVS